jgi:hypothetical protein
MTRGLPTFVRREFKVGLGVGTAITVLVGLIFLFLGASIDDAPAIIPSFPLWLVTFLGAELATLLVAWGGLAIYFGASRHSPSDAGHAPLALGLLAGALGGALFMVFMLLTPHQSGSSSDRPHRDKPRWD